MISLLLACAVSVATDTADGGVAAPVLYAWCQDQDGDGFGNVEVCVKAESPPEGYAADATDCDDTAADVYPGAVEHCDERDEDCDGAVDEDAVDPGTWYADLDGDGAGSEPVIACEQPAGTVDDAGDCDDTAADVYPGAVEHCDERDEDCDGAVDEDAVDPGTWYADLDGDGAGSEPVIACEQPAGTVDDAGDCDDTATDVHPGAVEHCDERDEDCDGAVDEDAVDPGIWYVDLDGDGAGSEPVIACEQPAGTVDDAGDCDDTAADVHPGAVETCDARDEDCDGAVDEDAVDLGTWYADVDGDGTGSEPVTACEQPAGTVDDAGDCDDTAADVYPGAVEHCDERDEDCDGAVDEDAVDLGTWYADVDGDGAGLDDATGTGTGCEPTLGWAAVGGDCDDTAADVYPGAPEICFDGIDNNCDGVDPEVCGPTGEVDLADAETRVIGDASTRGFGWNVAMVGDLDGDGAGDVVAELQLASEVRLFTPVRGSTTYAASSTASFSLGLGPDQMSAGGDLDDDGYDELLMGVTEDHDTIGLLIYEAPILGTLDRADAVATIDPTGVGGALFGALPIGDNDGDGADDLLVQSITDVTDADGGWGEYVGELFVVSGPFAGSTALTDAVASLHPSVWNEDGDFGAAACTIDLDGDGVNDVVGGAPGGSGMYALAVSGGAVYTAFGPFAEERTLDDGAGGLVDGDAFWGWATSDRFMRAGTSLSCGDTDGDGHPEILVGSNEWWESPGPGAAWLLPGNTTGSFAFADAPWSVTGTLAEETAGISVTLESDLDGDDHLDVVVGSYGEDSRGRVALFYGGALAGAVALDTADALWSGENAGDVASYVAGGDDLDGDGFDDLLIGAVGSALGGDPSGAIFAIYGGG